MSTSNILSNQNFNANDVGIMVFEPPVLAPRRSLGGLIDDMVQQFYPSELLPFFELSFEIQIHISSRMFQDPIMSTNNYEHVNIPRVLSFLQTSSILKSL